MSYGNHKDYCRLCKSKSLFTFLDLGNQPHSDEFKKKKNLIRKLFFSLLSFVHVINAVSNN